MRWVAGGVKPVTATPLQCTTLFSAGGGGGGHRTIVPDDFIGSSLRVNENVSAFRNCRVTTDLVVVLALGNDRTSTSGFADSMSKSRFVIDATPF
jgi:hypothetical protein